MVIMGVVVATIDASIGEVSDTPVRKHPWFITIPSKEAKNSNTISLGGTVSLGMNSEAIQKATAAPNILAIVRE